MRDWQFDIIWPDGTFCFFRRLDGTLCYYCWELSTSRNAVSQPSLVSHDRSRRILEVKSGSPAAWRCSRISAGWLTRNIGLNSRRLSKVTIWYIVVLDISLATRECQLKPTQLSRVNSWGEPRSASSFFASWKFQGTLCGGTSSRSLQLESARSDSRSLAELMADAVFLCVF